MGDQSSTGTKPRFFRSARDFGRWLQSHHDVAEELWVGFHRKSTEKPGLTWPESVDEALCYGWIDGIRKSVDETSYMIRFTPRRPRSLWSSVNTRRAGELIRDGRMRPSGLLAFENRDVSRSERYAHANRPAVLPPRYLRLLKANQAAWAFYRSQPPWYRRTAARWVISAVREETRLRRLSALIEDSALGKPIRPLARTPRAR